MVVERDLGATAAAFGADGRAWRALFGPLVQDGQGVLDEVLRPLPRLPRHPLTLARFGLRGLPPATLTRALLALMYPLVMGAPPTDPQATARALLSVYLDGATAR